MQVQSPPAAPLATHHRGRGTCAAHGRRPDLGPTKNIVFTISITIIITTIISITVITTTIIISTMMQLDCLSYNSCGSLVVAV